MTPRYTFPAGPRDITETINSYVPSNCGLGYVHWRYFREQGVNTANLARIFNKSWKTIRDWENLDDAQYGRPEEAITDEQ